MRIGHVDLDREVLLIAEIGNNHEGDVALAERLVGLAAEAGAQAVKFQTIAPERLVSAEDEARVRQLQKFALSRRDHERLARAAENAGVIFMSTPFFLEAVDWLESLVPAFKIASGDNDFDPLLARVAATGKPVVLSTGMATLEDIRHACSVLGSVWTERGVRPGLGLLQCVSAYPAAPEAANLAAMHALKPLCDAVGYSDHTLGNEVAVLAVAAGAQIIEKHFTIDKQFSSFRDHRLSADPVELKQLAQRIREASRTLGRPEKYVDASEAQLSIAARRSIVARRDLAAGHVIGLDDLDWLRPAGGLAPCRTAEVLGKKLARDVRGGERLEPNILL